MELDVWVQLICDHLVVVKHQLDDHPCVVTVILNNQPIRIVTISWKKLHSLHVKDKFLVKYNLYGDDPHDIRSILCVRVLSVGISQKDTLRKFSYINVNPPIIFVGKCESIQASNFKSLKVWTHGCVNVFKYESKQYWQSTWQYLLVSMSTASALSACTRSRSSPSIREPCKWLNCEHTFIIIQL